MVSEETEGYLKGFFVWDEDVKQEYNKIEELVRTEDEFWYLDNDGYRIEDEKLFEKSPWAIIYSDNKEKIVQRFMNGKTGEAWFVTKPWFRIGDWYDQK